MSHLFTPAHLGAIALTHRVVHAPTTRLRALPTILLRGDADAIAFGRYFTSNPDLPERFRQGLPLTPYVREAFWGGDERHYIDFPPYRELQSV